MHISALTHAPADTISLLWDPEPSIASLTLPSQNPLQSVPRRPHIIPDRNAKASLTPTLTTSGPTGPNSHRHQQHPRQLPTPELIIWEEAGLRAPASVRVRSRTPTRRGGDAQLSLQPQRNNGAGPVQERGKPKKQRHLHFSDIWKIEMNEPEDETAE